MNKLLLVAKETYLRQTKSWSFFLLVVSPFIFFFISAGFGYVANKAASSGNGIAIITTDKTIKNLTKKDDNFILDYKTESSAKKAVKDDEIAGYILVTNKDNKQIKAVYHGTDTMSSKDKVNLNKILQSSQTNLNIINARLSNQQLTQLNIQPKYIEKVAKSSVENKAIKTISYMLIAFLMYIVLITYTTTTAQEIATEKGTKIMEVIFSSMPATKYFYGKVLGILGVILTHIGLYLVGGLAIYPILSHLDFLKDYIELVPKVIANIVSVNLIFAILGIVIYTISAAFVGALVAKVEDTSKVIQPLMYLVMIGFFSSMALSGKPNSIIVTIFSYIPYISSFFMPIRTINGTASGIEVGISLVILLVTIILLVRYIARVYFGLILQNDDTSIWKNFKRGIKIK